MFSGIETLLRGLSSLTDEHEARLARLLVHFGQCVFTRKLWEHLRGFEHLTLIPDQHLRRYPIHLIPNENGKTLLMEHSVGFLPISTYPFRSAPTQNAVFGCFDPVFPESTVVLNQWLGNGLNAWDHNFPPADILKRVAQASEAVFFVHGNPCSVNPLANRLALKDGNRLTAMDVLASSERFDDTHVLLMACSSGWVDVKGTRHALGLVPAFLRRQARAVTGSLWPCRSTDASDLAVQLLSAKADGMTPTQAFSGFIRECVEGKSLVEAFFRYGCFVHFGHE